MSKNEDALPPALSAKDHTSFAYITMKDRIPVILSRTVDTLNRTREKIMEEYGGEQAREELKAVIGALSELRYEVMTNKVAARLRDSLPDVNAWNLQLETMLDQGDPLTWFESNWLWMECYLYRRVSEAVAMCNLLKNLDVFEEPKQSSLINSYQALSTLTTYLTEVITKVEKGVKASQLAFFFTQFLQMALWGNKCDLSISAGQDNYQTDDPLKQLSDLKPKLLVDDTDAVLKRLLDAAKAKGGQGGRVDIVMDNAGFELLSDWCLAEFLLSSGLATSVHFHIKAMPWFVSDVTEKDFNWTLHQMSAMNHIAMSQLAQKWKQRLNDKTWIIEVDNYWTMPNDYAQMEELNPALYQQLSQADLVIFKGDLNYRKLVGDLKWDYTTDFQTSLRGFLPAPLCALRALKSNSVTGLKKGQAEVAEKESSQWMVTGEWAVLSFSSGKTTSQPCAC